MKKQILTFILFTATITSWATAQLDTIPFWNIYYGNVIVIQGNLNQTETEKRDIKIKKGKSRELVVTFNYDIGPTDQGKLTIKQGDRILKLIEYQREEEGHSRLPTTGGGCFFLVPLKDIIDLKSKNGRWELDFYYNDQRGQENLKLGTIIFMT